MPDERSISERLQAQRNERALKDSAAAAKKTALAVDQMVRLSAAQVQLADAEIQLAQQTRADSARSERFTRTMAWSSLAVAVASLGAAVVAIVVSL